MGDLVSEALVKKLNTDKILFSDAGPTIPGISVEHMKKYLMELCWAVAKVCLLFAVVMRERSVRWGVQRARNPPHLIAVVRGERTTIKVYGK
eukprot:7403275-Pyramimonas_sp.AAC.1